MKILRALPLLAAGFVASACAADPAGEELSSSEDAIRITGSFTSKGTAYYPANSRLEGGFVDRKGARLRTLQQFLAGDADYVSVAMDSRAFSYGQRLHIRELDEKYGRKIVFRVVDTGGAFRGKGRSRIDVCVANRAASLDPVINGRLHIDIVDERSGPPEPSEPPPEDDADEAPAESAPAATECASDGACNPGNDGSGLVCESGRCVPGCRTNAQCPGATTCSGGQCR